MWATSGSVFLKPIYALIAGVVGLMIFSLAVWLPNLSLLKTVWLSQTASWLEKIIFSFSLYGSIMTNFTIESATYTILIAILFGVYSALIVFYVRSRRGGSNRAKSVGWLGVGGVTSGFLGVGCAACGTFVLSSLATVGGSSALLFLPLGGKEFGYLGVAILAYAIYSLSKKIKEPLICS